jgi:hypothetical protein
MVTSTVTAVANGMSRKRGVIPGHITRIRHLPGKPAGRADASIGEVVRGARNRQRSARQEKRQHPGGQASGFSQPSDQWALPG